MSKKKSYALDVQRRILEVLVAIAPDAPLPLGLVADIMSGDAMLHGPKKRVLKNMAGSTVAGSHALDQVGLAVWDTERDTVTIGKEEQAQATAVLQSLPMTKAMQKRRQGSLAFLDDIPSDMMLSMYDIASHFPGHLEGYSHDQLALMIPHFLHFVDTGIATSGEAWDAARALTTLWLLNAHGVVSEITLADYTDRLVRYCAPRIPEWLGEWMTAAALIQAAEEMIDQGGGKGVAATLLDWSERILVECDEEEQGEWPNLIQKARRKL